MRKPFRVLAALTLCLFVAACDSVEERAENHYQSALALVEEGDFDRATVEFRNVFELNPQHREARQSYAEMLLTMDDAPRAYAQYRRLSDQFPDDLDYRQILTRLAMDSQSWDEVRRHGPPLIEGRPDLMTSRVADVTIAYVVAIEEEDLPAQAGAAERARALREETTDYSVLNYILIQQALVDQQPEVALAELDELLGFDDSQVDLHILRLQILSSLNDVEEVEASLIRLVDQFPENDDFLVNLLQLYGSQGRADAAIDYLRGYIESREDVREARNTLIELVLATGGADAAIAEVDSLLAGASDGDATVLQTQRARLQFEGGDRDGGISAVEAIIEGQEASEEVNTAKMVLARMLIATGNQVGARRQVEEVLAADATNVAAMKMQAAWLIEDIKPDEAVSLLRTALDVSPEDVEAMLLMADAFSMAGSHELARDFISLAVQTSDHAPGPSLRFAQLLVSEDRLLLAEETLVNALRTTPDNVEILSALGRLQLQREDWPRVEQIEGTLTRIGTEDSLRIAAGFEVARLAATQRVDEAMGVLEQLGEQDGSVQTIAALVRAQLAAGNGEGALERAEDALSEDPENIGLQMVSASTRIALGQVEEGRAILEDIVSQNTQVEAAWTALIRLESATGTRESRDAMLNRALEAIPNSVGLGWAKASILTEDGETEEAIALYEELYERQSTSLVLANNLATLLANHRTDQESIDRAYAVARRLRGSEVPAFQDTYGWIAFRKGNLDEAEEYLVRAVASLPEEPSVQYHLAMVYLSQERKADALKHFEIAATVGGNTKQFPEIELARIEADKLIAEGVTPSE